MDFSNEVSHLKEKLIKRRRELHQFAESGWVEYRTASLVAEQLESLGYTVIVGKEACKTESRMGVPAVEILKYHEQRAIEEGANPAWVEKMQGGHTAVIGILRTHVPGPTIALRFDMDSNDMRESTNSQHRPVKEGFHSVHEGMMHACGHDGHTTIGLGLAEILINHKDQIKGEIRLIFQPAEEGCRGAKSVVDAGWLDNTDYFFSGHIGFKSRTLGEIVACVGGFLATTKINVTYTGRAAHAGESPQDGRNALLAGSAATLHLYGINRHSGGATRINVGTLVAGSGRNVIADKATLQLETRGETTELNAYMLGEAIRIIDNTARIYDVDVNWEIVGEGTGGRSSEELLPLIQQEAEKMGNITSFVPSVNLGASEDVVFMMNRVQEQGGKAGYMLFGSPLTDGHHQNKFDFDEEVLSIAVEILARLVSSTQGWGR